MPPLQHYTPDIVNPYPDEWREVRGFDIVQNTDVALPVPPDPGLNRKPHQQYYTLREFVVRCRVDGADHEVRVPSGMLSDLATIPKPLHLLIRRKGPHLPAVLIHDYLSVAWQDITDDDGPRGVRDDDFRFSNAMLREGLIALGYPRWAVRVVAWLASTRPARKRYDETNNAPRYVVV
jgi:hypothetical protein